MANIEEDYEFNCPYCMASQSTRLDRAGGRKQLFETDCEICCRPMVIEIEIEADGYIHFIAKREGEG